MRLFRFLFLLVVFLSSSAFGHGLSCGDYFYRLQSIRFVLDRLESNRFVVDRTLSDTQAVAGGSGGYYFTFGPEFKTLLMGLGANQRWLEAGVGDGLAVLEYFRAGGRGQVVGLSYVESNGHILNARDFPKQYRFVSGAIEKANLKDLGQFDVITDLFGPFAYVTDLGELLQIYLRLLKVGGVAFLKIPIERFSKFIVDGKSVSFDSILKKVPGLSVTTHEVTSIDKSETHIAVQLRLLDKSAIDHLPKFELIEFFAGAPPRRQYNVIF